MDRRLGFLIMGAALACAADDTDDSAGGTESSDTTAGPTSVGSEPTVPSTSATSTASTDASSGSNSTTTGNETTDDAATGSTGDSGTATTTTGAVGDGGSFNWVLNRPAAHEYGHQLELPPTFGEAEFTFQMWIKPDDSFPVGSTAGSNLMNWSDEDEEPYTGNWWFRGNFLLDGHNNNSGFSDGTFSLQFYGGGRVRWLFGDGSNVTGGVWSAGAYPADTTPSLLDGNWHQLTLVRRWSAGNSADLELWIDGALVDTETTPARTDMRDYWDTWAGFGAAQAGWFWGTEKQAAVGDLSSYEDYKGLMAELRFWDIALDDIESTYAETVTGDEAGLVGYYPWTEGSGTQACDTLSNDCATLYLTEDSQWMDEGPPLQ